MSSLFRWWRRAGDARAGGLRSSRLFCPRCRSGVVSSEDGCVVPCQRPCWSLRRLHQFGPWHRPHLPSLTLPGSVVFPWKVSSWIRVGLDLVHHFLKMGKHICHHYMLLQVTDDRGERHRSVISWVMPRALLVNRCNQGIAPSLRDVAWIVKLLKQYTDRSCKLGS